MKKELAQILIQKLHLKKEFLENQMHSLQQDLSNESKSSMGDKYETGRAMIHLEMEKLQSQMQVLNNEFHILNSLETEKKHHIISFGSLVFTNQNHYFISIGFGEIIHNQEKVYTISKDSPIGKHLLGKKIDEVFSFNEKEIRIERIV